MTALPSRRDEAWRYSDLAAVAALWPPPPARQIVVRAGEQREELLRVHAGGIHDLRVDLGAGAALTLVLLVESPGYARVFVEADLADAASLDLGAVLLAGGDATSEIVTDIRHQGPGASSRQRVRLVVDERATGSCLGRIAVARGAQKTDAALSARALVLKRTATANLKPELEIFADDVQCAHGCTVGELDKSALFYLQSRGIGRVEAEALLTRAFVADGFTRLKAGPARDALEAATAQWLEARL